MDNVVCFLFVVIYYPALPSFLTTHHLAGFIVRKFPVDVGVVISLFAKQTNKRYFLDTSEIWNVSCVYLQVITAHTLYGELNEARRKVRRRGIP